MPHNGWSADRTVAIGIILTFVSVLRVVVVDARCGESDVNADLIRCASHFARCLNPLHLMDNMTLDAGPIGYKCQSFRDTNGTVIQLSAKDKCNYGWRDRPYWFVGGTTDDGVRVPPLERVIFAGDSTILRDYMHAMNVTMTQYTTKVKNLDEEILQGNITLASGRMVELIFFRLLHVSVAGTVVNEIFKRANNRTLIVLTIGPHDTSWLVFRRAMPGYKRSNVGRWDAAQAYWRRHTSRLAQLVGQRLRDYGPKPEQRPYVILREQYLANCNHMKYSKYPLITRCKDLLMPKVIPYYRDYAKATFGALGIPIVGIDPLMPEVCHLVDAGHVNRPCKDWELGMLFSVYRSGRASNSLQGFHEKCIDALSAWDGPWLWGEFINKLSADPVNVVAAVVVDSPDPHVAFDAGLPPDDAVSNSSMPLSMEGSRSSLRARENRTVNETIPLPPDPSVATDAPLARSGSFLPARDWSEDVGLIMTGVFILVGVILFAMSNARIG